MPVRVDCVDDFTASDFTDCLPVAGYEHGKARIDDQRALLAYRGEHVTRHQASSGAEEHVEFISDPFGRSANTFVHQLPGIGTQCSNRADHLNRVARSGRCPPARCPR